MAEFEEAEEVEEEDEEDGDEDGDELEEVDGGGGRLLVVGCSSLKLLE